MKQKTSYWLIALLMVCSVVFGGLTGYFCAFYHVKSSQKTFEKEMQKEMTASIDENVKKEASTAVQNAVKENMKSIQAEASNQKLSVDTVYQVQKYDAASKQTTTEYETLPKELVGLDRDETDAYCKKYMSSLPVQEYLDGLQSFGVVAFAKDRLIVKKIYDSSKVTYRYYLIAIDGEVVVYYGDKNTIYEYTGIETKNLTTEERTQLKKGVEVKDENELYSILENYSS